MAKQTDFVTRLTRLGAPVRMAQIKTEIANIFSEFPELREGTRGRGNNGRLGVRSTTRRRRSMSAAARKAVSERMRKYWAQRRKKAAAKPS